MMDSRRAILKITLAPVAWPAVLLYALIVRIKDAGYRTRLLRPKQLSCPVISIGNLSVGGTGKTPLVLLLSRLLEARGWSIDVLSRGYRRQSSEVVRVNPENGWHAFGDEPFFLAQQGLAVYVGADRYRAGLLAESDSARAKQVRPLHILDDGFQHRRLARSVDIVLLHRHDLQDEMLPLGRLREPLAALERADICVLRSEDADLTTRVLQLMGHTDPSRVWIVQRKTTIPKGTTSLATGKLAFAFCAIGDADGFFKGLRDAGVSVREQIAFRDHHVYTAADVALLKTAARKSGAQFLITTEKDAIRISTDLRQKMETDFPLTTAGLDVTLQYKSGCIDLLERILKGR